MLKTKVAGIPVIYIAGIFVAVLVVFAYRTKNVSDTAPKDNADADAATDGDQGGNDPNSPFVANPTTPYVAPGANASDNPAPVQDTNDLWVHRAAEWLASQKKASATDALIALSGYVNGDHLSYAQGQLRDAAVANFGLPPEAIHPGTVGAYAGPASKQGTPPTHHTVKGTSDDSWGELGTLYYGSNSKANTLLLKSANLTLPPAWGSTQVLPPGTTVAIPRYHNPHFYRARKGATTEYEIAARNGTTVAALYALNPGVKFPVTIGRGVRVS